MDLEMLVAPVVEGMGLEFVEASFRREGGRRVLRVTIDRAGGVDLDTIAEASARVSRRLDVEDFASGPYTLEVSSPGLERRLRRPADYAARVGEKVKVRTRRPVDGARTHIGLIRSADEEGVVVATEAGERTIPLAEVASARLVFEWGSERSKR